MYQRRYKIINIPRDFLHTNAHQLASSRLWPHMVAALNCDMFNGSLAQTLQFWSLVTTILVWCRDPQGSPMKVAAKVYFVKSENKVMTQYFWPCMWHFHTFSSVHAEEVRQGQKVSILLHMERRFAKHFTHSLGCVLVQAALLFLIVEYLS